MGQSLPSILSPTPQSPHSLALSQISVKMYCLNRYSCTHQCPTCTLDAYVDHIDLWSQWQDLSLEGAESLEDEVAQRVFEGFLDGEGFRGEDVPWRSRVAGELRGCLYAQGGYSKRYSYIAPVICQNPIDVDIEHWFVIGPDASQPFRTANESTIPPSLEQLAEIWDAGASGNFEGPVGSAAHAAGRLWGPGGLYSPGPLPQPLRLTKPRTPTESNVISDSQGSQAPTNDQANAHVDMTNSRQEPPGDEDDESAGVDIVKTPEPKRRCHI